MHALFAGLLLVSPIQSGKNAAAQAGSVVTATARDSKSAARAVLRGHVLNPQGRPLTQAQVRLQSIDWSLSDLNLFNTSAAQSL